LKVGVCIVCTHGNGIFHAFFQLAAAAAAVNELITKLFIASSSPCDIRLSFGYPCSASC